VPRRTLNLRTLILTFLTAARCSANAAALASRVHQMAPRHVIQVRQLFLLHCHATVFQAPTSSLDRLRMRTTIPFLSCRQHSGWRELAREKEKGRRDLRPKDGTLKPEKREPSVRTAAAGYGKCKNTCCEDTSSPPRPVSFSLCCPVCQLTFH